MISRIAFLDDLTDEQVKSLEEKLGDEYEVFKQGNYGWTNSAYIPISRYADDDDELESEELSTEESANEREEFVCSILAELNIGYEIGQY